MIWIEIITIGGEILSGRTADTNFAFLARRLRTQGLSCRWHTTVPDEREPLGEALESALSRANVVITTGGLGATPDDITRKLLAAVLKRQLVLREDLLQAIEDRYVAMGRTPPPNLQAQALIPFGSELIENEVGLAPGLRLRVADQRLLYALPGVPAEMERMAERFVLPEIASLEPGLLLQERCLRTAGVSEMLLAETVEPVLPPGVRAAYLPHLGMVDLRFTTEGEAAGAAAKLESAVAEVRRRLGPVVFAEGEETLEETVGELLLARGWRLAVAESLTGGALGGRIVQVPGASRYYLGGITAYDNAAKISLLGVPENWLREHGAVSAAVAESMAQGLRERLGADVALSTTGIAGPDGGSPEKPVGLVYFGIARQGQVMSVRRQFGGDRMSIVGRTINTGLDLLRRVLMGLDVESGSR